PIQIVKKMENVEDGSVIIVIDDGRGKTREESMDILTSQKIESLTRYGFGITPKNKYDIAEEVYEALLQYLIQNQHKISSGRHEYGRTRETIGHYEPTQNVFRYESS